LGSFPSCSLRFTCGLLEGGTLSHMSLSARAEPFDSLFGVFSPYVFRSLFVSGLFVVKVCSLLFSVDGPQ